MVSTRADRANFRAAGRSIALARPLPKASRHSSAKCRFIEFDLASAPFFDGLFDIAQVELLYPDGNCHDRAQ